MLKDLLLDVDRYLKLSDEELNWIISAACQFRCSDTLLIEILVNYVHQMDDMKLQLKKHKFTESFDWVRSEPHHVKAITLAGMKRSQANHPDLVKLLLHGNREISLEFLLQTIQEEINEDYVAA